MSVTDEIRQQHYGETPQEGTTEWCQYMTALLVEVLNDEYLKHQQRVTRMDIRRLAGTASPEADTAFDDDIGAHLANLRMLAVEEYKIRNGLKI